MMRYAVERLICLSRLYVLQFLATVCKVQVIDKDFANCIINKDICICYIHIGED